ncbi:MAG: hypothetical protein HY554_15260 [Elusimicrobia bacterium]|nr:hypothetical protein [Elusimicrobiota bacterium]
MNSFNNPAISCALCAVAGLALAGAAAAEETGTDPSYFADAAKAVSSDLRGVLEFLVSHPRKPSPGFRRLPFQPEPDADAEPEIDCDRLQAAPRAKPAPGEAADGYAVCGVRLLRWRLGDADRLQLPVTAERAVGGRTWLQVVVEPAEDRRAWLPFAPGRGREPLMRRFPLSDWITGSGTATILRPEGRRALLRAGPAEEKEPAPRQLPGAGHVQVRVRGIQGRWLRVELEGDACRGDPEADGALCPAGWLPWRSDSGQPLVVP